MWPSIPAYRGFGNITCPSGTRCELPHCIFSHESPKPAPVRLSPVRTVAASDREPEANRQMLDDSTKNSIAIPVEQGSTKPSVFVGLTLPKPKEPVSTANNGTSHSQTPTSITAAESKNPTTLPASVTRPVSPPTTAAAKARAKPDIPIPLMPRKLVKEPATFTKRVALLKALHAYMKPQNDRLLKAKQPEVKALHLTPNQLIKLAVDEEAKIASVNQAVYENELKHRLVRLKNMTPEIWVKERREALAKENGDAPRKPPQKKVDTGLTPKEEITFLSILKCPQTGLDAHGYVTKLPSEEDLVEAQKTIEASDFWEECDRCSTRFQVFPDRREEDGALTTGGQCRHHWGKRIYPKKNKSAAVPEPTTLTCCNEPVGSPGCTTHETHVFNVKSPKRLSLIMPFMETPENDKAPPHTAVCFDCEMGYTTNGLELMRLTVISWPMHRPIIDVLVRPLGHILDVNTRFSGITAEQFLNAKPFDPADPKPVRKDLRIVDSPYAARDLFLSHVSPTTPVLGHALENDLNTIRLIHPTIIDTVLLYPTRQGLPYRHGLRALAKLHLQEDIQQGGAAGHDSYEDARTTGELIRCKIKEKWKLMKMDGWVIRDDGVFPPMPAGTPPPQAATQTIVSEATTAVLEGKPAEKRKLEDDWEVETGEEPAAKKTA
ncbi:RNA exonuclease-like protein Rex3 [Plenodomus tracheiphilus IPT5]|uniref:RNA exonuclease-like protein Rex3 n=1 Tax=Plenodomus tracheiphilus IPT5 TaxID=1408161 RepID=A0A6A7B8H5_9PLEO|nr:RNA exonuclease-like protein Rex3 [Plenodomus tracheiphilus IPT5]